MNEMTTQDQPVEKAKNFFDRYASVDNKQMQDGAEIDFGGGFFVTVRHASADAVTAARTKITKQLKLFNRNKELSPEQQLEITRYVAAHAGIVSWRGGGVPPFSSEFAMDIFVKKPEFLEDVVTAMSTYETFRQEDVDDAVGN